jgi:hypothetical protein
MVALPSLRTVATNGFMARFGATAIEPALGSRRPHAADTKSTCDRCTALPWSGLDGILAFMVAGYAPSANLFAWHTMGLTAGVRQLQRLSTPSVFTMDIKLHKTS